MPLYEDWPPRDAAQAGPFYAVLLSPPRVASGVAPPALANLNDVIVGRRKYTEQYIDRERICESLRDSYIQRGAPQPVLSNVERLREPDVHLVVTGQQPGLLGGPLYTLYKAAQAIALAKQLSAQRSETFLPAFWNASEDHDFNEIATVNWLNKDRRVDSFTWNLKLDKRPLYGIAMDELPLDELIAHIDESTHPSDFKEDFFQLLRRRQKQAKSYPDFFDALVWQLFGEDGLIILRPDDQYSRQEAARIIASEIERPNQSSLDITAAGEALKEVGLPQQLHKAKDRAAFFLVRNNQRQAVTISPNGFQTENGELLSSHEMKRILTERPDEFSPSAILRPVVQDAIYPTIAAVLGPGEMGYHFLLDGIYKRHGVSRPAVVPRLGITWLEPRDRKTIKKWSLQPEDLNKDLNALMKELVAANSGAAPPHNRLDSELNAWFDALTENAKAIDKSIEPVLEKNLKKIQKEVESSESLVLRRMANKESETRSQIESLQSALMPNGNLQERELSFVSLYLKHGPAFIEQLKTVVDNSPLGSHVYAKI